MAVQKLFRIQLEAGDVVVSTTYFEGLIIVVTKLGNIYRVNPDRRFP